ncbi:MAG: tRNA (cytidine(34)-2'-O)-methyltransferase [Phycisphaerales bacterium JB061]|jgi:tRNA (cytidine/uridine-2'-O-)-methyltransferase
MFHVVLHEPEIPNNTGNIGRTCVATGSGLHLIEPLGFDIDEKACRRAGLDYWPRLSLRTHADFDAYASATPGARRWMLSTKGGSLVYDADLRPGDHLVFGKESRGLPGEILERAGDRLLRLPMMPGERSLNLSSTVCTVLYEGVRQCLARGEAELDTNRSLVWSGS